MNVQIAKAITKYFDSNVKVELNILKKNISYIIAASCVLIFITLILLVIFKNFLLGILFILPVLLYIVFLNKYINKYRYYTKQLLLNTMILSVNSEAKYYKDDAIETTYFENSGLCVDCETIIGKNYFELPFNDKILQICEYRGQTNALALSFENNSSYSNIFALYNLFPFESKFNFKVSVKDLVGVQKLPDVIYTQSSLIEINEKFDKQYNIYTNDEEKFKQLFQKDLVNQLLAFNETLDSTIELSLRNNTLYLSISNDSFFSTETEKNELDVENVEYSLNIVKIIEKIYELFVEQITKL